MNKIGSQKIINGRYYVEVTCMECGHSSWVRKDHTLEKHRCLNCNSLGTLNKRIEDLLTIDNQTGCQNWTGSLNKDGYAVISLKHHKIRVAKFLLEQKFGRPLSENSETCHICNNRKCVNLDHVYEGTHKDNGTDLSKRGILKGKGGKITENTARQIKEKLLHHTVSMTAKIFNVPISLVDNIKRGNSWKWLTIDERVK